MRGHFFLMIMACNGMLCAQLSNQFFRRGPAMPKTKWGGTFEALQYLKNNEYYNNLNPGSTLFGFQTRGLMHYRITESAVFSAGALLQRDFGDQQGLSRAIPLFNFELRRGFWLWNLGNIKPHIHHNLAEPLTDYENILRIPVEGGLQAIRRSESAWYDVWLEWRELANARQGTQERIVFGQSLEKRLVKTSSYYLSLPFQNVIYHQGGQALNLNSHVRTHINVGAGLRLGRNDSLFLAEALWFGSMDNSPAPSQPYQDGWAIMGNLRLRPHPYHEIALSWWYAREFSSPTGNPVFSNVNASDVYLNRNTRRLAMLRYVFSRPVVGEKLWVDFRLEPYYDLEYKSAEFSHGLFFRYVETLQVRLPRWMGL